MSPKGILIAFAIVSLLLIGMMFLVVDVRNNPVTESKPTSNTIEEFKKLDQAFQDSLKTKTSSNDLKNNKQLVATINQVTDAVLSEITTIKESLFPGGLAAHDLKTSDRVEENNAVFFRRNGDYSEQSTRFLASVSTFENTIRSLQNKYPALKAIKAQVRDTYSVNTDWLTYNFKDFPAVASYSKLQLLAEAIKSKKEEVITAMLTNQ